jgi:hypothetical protein
MPVLQVPSRLEQFIKSKFIDLRIPGKDDLTGPWATWKGKPEVPYACWGDFNGDGLTDIGLILLGKGYWRVLAFHQLKDGGYVPLRLEDFPGPSDEEYTREHAAQEFRLFTLKAGKPVEIKGQSYPVTVTNHDTIGLFMVRDPSSGLHYHWFAAPDSTDPEFRLYGMYGTVAFGELTD